MLGSKANSPGMRLGSAVLLMLASLVTRPSTPNAVEGLVKLVHRMMSGGRLEAWLITPCMHNTVFELPCCSVSMIFATSASFHVLSLGYAHAQLRSFYPLSTFNAFHATKKKQNQNFFLRLHNFNVHILERGSLGTRLPYWVKF